MNKDNSNNQDLSEKLHPDNIKESFQDNFDYVASQGEKAAESIDTEKIK